MEVCCTFYTLLHIIINQDLTTSTRFCCLLNVNISHIYLVWVVCRLFQHQHLKTAAVSLQFTECSRDK